MSTLIKEEHAMRLLRLPLAIVLILVGITGLALSSIAIYAIWQVSASASTQTAVILELRQGRGCFPAPRYVQGPHSAQGDETRTLDLEATLTEVKNNPRTPLQEVDQKLALHFKRRTPPWSRCKVPWTFFRTLSCYSIRFRFFQAGVVGGERSQRDQRTFPVPARSLGDTGSDLSFLERDPDRSESVARKIDGGDGLGRADSWQIGSRRAAGRAVSPETERRRDQLSTIQQEVPSWIKGGSAFAIAMLICFAFTQVGLLLHAASLVRKDRSPTL